MPELTFPHLHCHVEQGVLVAALTTPVVQDDDTAEALRRDLHAALDHAKSRHAVLDMGSVQYLGSSGFRPLLSIYRRLQAQGGRVVLCRLTPDVEEVFLVTRLIGTGGSGTAPFEKAPDVRAAVRSLKRVWSDAQGGALVLTVLQERLQGDETAAAIRQDLLDAFERGGTGKVVVDCRAVKVISSAGIRPLLQLRQKVKEKGGRLALCGLNELVRDVLEATRLTTSAGSAAVVFETATDVAAAVALLNRA
jgi:anti-anti-sigma factor